VTIPGNINVISGNSGQFFGNVVTGFGALYAGLPAGYTLLNQEVMQFSDSFNGYTQVTHRNINGGDQATTDYVATADNGTDTLNYVDLGIAGSGYNGLLANNSLGNSLFANDSYLYAQGNVAGGNLVLGTIRTGAVVRIITGASDLANVRATFSSTGLAVNGNISADYFIGNGSLLSNITGANITGNVSSAVTAGTVTTNAQPNITSVGTLTSLAVTGNISGSYLLGNGAFITGLPAGYSNADVSTYLASGTDTANIITTGNISGSYILGNGSQLTSLPAPTVSQDITSNGNMSLMAYDGNIK
jgi:hypothetical protein